MSAKISLGVPRELSESDPRHVKSDQKWIKKLPKASRRGLEVCAGGEEAGQEKSLIRTVFGPRRRGTGGKHNSHTPDPKGWVH